MAGKEQKGGDGSCPPQNDSPEEQQKPTIETMPARPYIFWVLAWGYGAGAFITGLKCRIRKGADIEYWNVWRDSPHPARALPVRIVLWVGGSVV